MFPLLLLLLCSTVLCFLFHCCFCAVSSPCHSTRQWLSHRKALAFSAMAFVHAPGPFLQLLKSSPSQGTPGRGIKELAQSTQKHASVGWWVCTELSQREGCDFPSFQQLFFFLLKEQNVDFRLWSSSNFFYTQHNVKLCHHLHFLLNLALPSWAWVICTQRSRGSVRPRQTFDSLARALVSCQVEYVNSGLVSLRD